MSNPESSLPPGFRFHPTDEELILHYLRNRATSTPCPVSIIAEVDIYKFDPWELPARAAFGEKEWYFFSPRDRKYPNGARPNRAAASGYWKATGTDKPILATSGNGHENIGVKKALVFYRGRPPKGIKTNWIMHEYRLAEAVNKPIRIKDSSMRLDDWVLCRIYMKSSHLTSAIVDVEQEDPSRDDVFLSRIPNPTDQKTTLNLHKSPSLSNSLDATDYSFLSRLMLDNLPDSSGSELCPILGYNNIDNPISNNNHYLMQRLPTTDLSVMDNQHKRQRSMVGNQEEGTLHPSKKYSSSCTFTNFTNQFDTSQYHMINQNFFNQQILLNSHLQFQ